MAKAKKLPSGSWRTQVYSHSELEYNKDGTIKIDSKAVTQSVNHGQTAFTRFFKHQSGFPKFKKRVSRM